MKPWLFNRLTVASLLLSVAMFALWLRSYGVNDGLGWDSGTGDRLLLRSWHGNLILGAADVNADNNQELGGSGLKLRYVAVPHAYFVALSAALPLYWLGQSQRRRRELRRKGGLCPECGYDLRATPGWCPECGLTVPSGDVMRWTVDVKHAATGEDMRLEVDAATRQQAEARARESGFVVRDCYRRGRGACKVIRTVAWVWFGIFALPAVLTLLCGLGGFLATPGDSGVKGSLASAAVLSATAALGFITARAMTRELRRDPPTDLRRGFDIEPNPNGDGPP